MISVLIAVIAVIIIIFSFKDRLLVQEIKHSYVNKEDLSVELINKIKKFELDNQLSPEQYFMLGYLYLFEEDNATLAYTYFKQVIEQEESVYIDFARTYSYKFLAENYLANDDLELALLYTKKALYSIDPKNHGDYRNLINDIMRPILEIEESRTVIIDFLEYILKENYNHPNKEAAFYAYRTLEQFYMLEGNYPQSVAASMQAIELAKDLDKHFFEGKSLVNLARLLHQFDDHESALDVLEIVEHIQAEDAEWHDKLNIHRLLILYQVTYCLQQYDEALKHINEFDYYKANLTVEDRQDIEIVQYISKANLMIQQNQVEEATLLLEEAAALIKIDNVTYWTDKDIYYSIAMGRLNEKMKNDQLALDYYHEARNLAIKRNNLEALRDSFGLLISLYQDLGQIQSAKYYEIELDKLTSYESKKISKSYINHLNLKDEMTVLQQRSQVAHLVNIILIGLGIIALIFTYRINIRPTLTKRKLKQKIERHLLNEDYLLYYQPIIDPKNEVVVGFEGLLRLKINEKIILPYIIINEIEQADMMEQVSLWILKQIIQDANIIKENMNLTHPFYVSMNMSLKELEKDSFINDVIKIIENSKQQKHSICIEITENVGITQLDKAKENIMKLKQLGTMIAIDDFGVEYSNFSIIDTLEYDVVKIDKTFINNIENSEVNRGIINFCDHLFGNKNKAIVIEGVEDKHQVAFIKLTTSNKFYIQGYYYAKPLELRDIIQFNIKTETK